jgi:hypothetical protein
MSSFVRVLRGPAAALFLLLVSACASDDGYSGYGGVNSTVAVGYGYDYYPGGYYPYYPPGYGCCWYDDGGRPIEVPPPGNRPDRPTTLPGQPSQLPAERPNQPSTRPAPSTRPSTGMSSRPAPRPTPAPRPMGGGGRRR